MGSELRVGFDDQALDFPLHNPPLCFLSVGKESSPCYLQLLKAQGGKDVGKKNPEGLSNWAQKI